MAMTKHKIRERHGDIENPHQYRIGDAAEIAGQQADHRADDERADDPEERHLKIDARAIDEPRQDIAAEAIGAKRMFAARRLQGSARYRRQSDHAATVWVRRPRRASQATSIAPPVNKR